MRPPGTCRSRSAHATLPQVLFCSLTPGQRELYRAYLASPDVAAILDGGRQALAGIDILRKICNHPDLLERAQSSGKGEYGAPDKSGAWAGLGWADALGF
jgi:SNF2 family DNA or RNA helicase